MKASYEIKYYGPPYNGDEPTFYHSVAVPPDITDIEAWVREVDGPMGWSEYEVVEIPSSRVMTQVQIRMRAEDHAKIAAKAKRHGLGFSELVRDLTWKWYKGSRRA